MDFSLHRYESVLNPLPRKKELDGVKRSAVIEPSLSGQG